MPCTLNSPLHETSIAVVPHLKIADTDTSVSEVCYLVCCPGHVRRDWNAHRRRDYLSTSKCTHRWIMPGCIFSGCPANI
ncbi:hypothetical protein RSOLAG1IB_00395 [Rhizoctonia solani AG-1 IB]|uniref:Uncharacterized protein n=1 Tax=Thanatephorus cucumeris (strain AG1-IB / isolate 7/3/14) TaxID=1108050 RepID=A0A0B7F6M5_THACB|nr:hypothetical protein RSOLAG1IB_00395 [Rhizoctonia solani AG-1 IB]